MNTETQKVDVLAVMDADRFAAIGDRDYYESDFARSLEARAAVAELIDAAQHVLNKEWEYGEDQPACARLNAALARIGGSK